MRITHSLAIAIAAVLTAAPLFSASVPRIDLPALVERSPRIVHGEVVRRWTAWDSSGRYIWTHSEIRVLEAVRGGTGRLVVSTPGGEIDGRTMHVPGATAFRTGEEVVVFAYPVPNGLWRLRGWSQGKFQVSPSAAGGRLVRPAPGSLNLVSSGDRKAPPLAAAGLAAQTLPAFLSRIRQQLQQEGR